MCLHRKKSAGGRPASCSCTCETLAIPSAASLTDAKYQQQQQQQQPAAPESEAGVDGYYSDWTGDNHVETSDNDYNEPANRDNTIPGQSMLDDVSSIDRQANYRKHLQLRVAGCGRINA